MESTKEKFIVDGSGKKLEVILSINEYDRLLAEIEEKEEIKAYDNAKSSDDELIPFDIAMKEIGL